MTRWHIEPADLERILPLRSAFGRDGTEPASDCVSVELDANAVHWVAVCDDTGRDIGCGSVSRDAKLVGGQWATHRLRWLSVDPAYRGRGIGSELVRVRLAHVQSEGGRFAWAFARSTAAPLYVTLGARVASDLYAPEAYGGLHVDVLYGPLPTR